MNNTPNFIYLLVIYGFSVWCASVWFTFSPLANVLFSSLGVVLLIGTVIEWMGWLDE